jgi:hypothetical protein
MQVLDDFVEYIALGSVAFCAFLSVTYVLSPQALLILLTFVQATPASFWVIVPFILFLGFIFHQISYSINRPLLHRRLFRSILQRYKNFPDLTNQIRGKPKLHCFPYSKSENLEKRVGDALEWSRFYLYQFGSDELQKQVLRIFYLYRISYGSFFSLIVCLLSGLIGAFLPNRDNMLCLTVSTVAGVLLIGAYISARNTIKLLWRYLAYSAEVLFQEHRDKPKQEKKRDVTK